jgi:WD40 repeat protein
MNGRIILIILQVSLLFQFAKAQQPRLVLPVGHTSEIRFAQFSPDSKRIVTASNDNTAKLWDVRSGKLLADLKEHSGIVCKAVFNREGSLLMTASFDSTAIIRNANNAVVVQKIKSTSGRITDIEFSPDSRFVAMASEDFTRDNQMIYGNEVISIMDVSTGKLIRTLRDIWGEMISLQFSKDSKYLLAMISISKDFGNIRYKVAGVWDLKTGDLLIESKADFASFDPDGKQILMILPDGAFGKCMITLDAQIQKVSTDGRKCRYACFSPDSKFVGQLTGDSLVVRETLKGEILNILPLRYQENNSLGFSNDNRYIFSVTSRYSLLYDRVTGKIMDSIDGQGFSTQFAIFSPDGKLIATPVFENTMRIRIVQSHRPVVVLQGHTVNLEFSEFSPDGKYMLTIIQENSLINYACLLWETATGSLIRKFNAHEDDIKYAQFTPDSKKIITAGLDSKLKVWSVPEGNLLYETEAPFYSKFSIDISPDGKYFVTTSGRDEAMFGKVGDRNKMKMLKIQGADFTEARFSPNGEDIILFSDDDNIYICDAKTFKLRYSVNGHSAIKSKESTSRIFSSLHMPIAISNDSKYLVTVSLFGPVMIHELSTGKFIREIKNASELCYSARISPDNRLIATTGFDHQVHVWDFISGNLLFSLNIPGSIIRSLSFSLSGDRIITISDDHTLRAWDARMGKLLYMFFPVGSSGYFITEPSGYYQCTSDAAKLLHYVTTKLDIISFGQLDIRYNRPDKIMEAMQSEDTMLINSYRRAYYKRIRKLHIDTNSFSGLNNIPEAEILNRNEIEFEQISDKLLLKIKCHDSIAYLDRFNIWINEVPLFGLNGKSLKQRASGIFDTAISIVLSMGENHIEISVTNVNGIESYRMPLIVNYQALIEEKEKLHFIGLGIDQFANPSYDLKYSTKDISDLCEKLKEKYKDRMTIDTLFNKNLTRNNVALLKLKLQNTGVNDKVVLCYSGHGLLSREYDYYLSTYAVDFSNPERDGLSYDVLESLLDSIPARKKLMLIDACHSGEVDKEEVMVMLGKADSIGLSKGSKLLDIDSSRHLGLNNSFELMQSLFVNVAKNTGTIIISAAAGNQFALESGRWNNGVFTYCILEAMQNYQTMKVNELKKKVSERVQQLTNGLQKPTYRNETIDVDWSIW